jgi:hypothetical protein
MSVSSQPIEHNTGDQQRVFVDFHNADAQGRLRLNCIGTTEDLSVQNIKLQSGQQLTLYSEDLEVDGVVEYSNSEHLWVVIINWNEIRQIEEVNPAQQNLFNNVEKLRSVREFLETDTQVFSDGSQGSAEHELGKSLGEVKQDLKNADAALSQKQDISETIFYQQFASIFGEAEAKEIWSARNWNTNVVWRDLALILMDEPKLRQNIEQKGFNLEEIVDMPSWEGIFKEFSTELPQTDNLARLREVIYC